MRFIGDVHGNIDRYLGKINGNSFQVGDMGLGFDGVTLPTLKGDRFIRGNHDDPAVCKEHPNYAGEFGYWKKEKLFFCGGAFSIDWKWRQKVQNAWDKKVWWADEELSLEALEAAYRMYISRKPEIVVTHDCPRTVSVQLLQKIAIGFRPEKDLPTRTGHALDRMFHFHQPKTWIFGHYHIDKDFVVEGTRFICLAELSTIDL